MGRKRVVAVDPVPAERLDGVAVAVPARRKYSDEELYHMKVVRKLTEDEMEVITGTTKQNISQRLKAMDAKFERVERFKRDEVPLNYDIRRRILESISDKDINEAKLQAKAIVYGILVDKQRLISGESTQNIASWTSIVSQSHRLSEKDVVPVETTAEEVAK